MAGAVLEEEEVSLLASVLGFPRVLLLEVLLDLVELSDLEWDGLLALQHSPELMRKNLCTTDAATLVKKYLPRF